MPKKIVVQFCVPFIRNITIKQHILSDLQAKRMVGGKESIAKTTFYRAAEQVNLFNFLQILRTPGLFLIK